MGSSGICAELALCSPDSRASSSLTFFPSEAPNFWFLFVWFCSVDSDRFSLLLGGRIQLSATIKYSLEFSFSEHLRRTCCIYLTKKVTFRSSVYKIQSINSETSTGSISRSNTSLFINKCYNNKSHQQCYIVHFVFVALYFLNCAIVGFILVWGIWIPRPSQKTNGALRIDRLTDIFDCMQKVSSTTL